MRKIFGVLCCVFVLSSVCVSAAEDPGYFLSWQQKKELLGLGRMQDSEGVWYDVWICPGYVSPSQSAREHLKKAGENFHEYVEPGKYRSLKKGSKACFEWAVKDCGADYIIKGIPQSWDRYFSVAHKRTQRRVFGWWLAYPWALMESSANMAFRGVVGSSGVAAGVACATAVVPAYHVLGSAIEGTWNLGVETVALPASAITWNTMVGLPLALIGQKPSESRVDGFWVTRVDAAPRKLTAEEIGLLGQWGQVLREEIEPFEQKQEESDANSREKEERLRKELREVRDETNRKRNALNEEKKIRIQQVITQSDLAFTVPEYTSRDVLGNKEDLRRYFREQDVSDEEAGKILSLLSEFSSSRGKNPSVRKKTDPLLRGVEVIGDSAEDMLSQ